jgi:hypothetical protein
VCTPPRVGRGRRAYVEWQFGRFASVLDSQAAAGVDAGETRSQQPAHHAAATPT